MTQQLLSSGSSLTLIHYTYEVGGNWCLACMPSMREFHQTVYHTNYLRSNDHRAVTCPACQKSEVFGDAKKRT